MPSPTRRHGSVAACIGEARIGPGRGGAIQGSARIRVVGAPGVGGGGGLTSPCVDAGRLPRSGVEPSRPVGHLAVVRVVRPLAGRPANAGRCNKAADEQKDAGARDHELTFAGSRPSANVLSERALTHDLACFRANGVSDRTIFTELMSDAHAKSFVPGRRPTMTSWSSADVPLCASRRRRGGGQVRPATAGAAYRVRRACVRQQHCARRQVVAAGGIEPLSDGSRN